jgi:transposase
MDEVPEPESRRALHDALVAEIEELAERIREITAQIERRPRDREDAASRLAATVAIMCANWALTW